MQERRNASALVMELRFYCINPSIYDYLSYLMEQYVLHFVR